MPPSACEPVPATQVVARDRHAEYLWACASVGATIELIATEVRHLACSEVGEGEEPFGAGQKGSSAMPHKRNPILSERLCGLARVLRGYAGAGLEDVALWHERDISHSSVERVVLPDASLLTCYVLRKATDLVRGLVVHPEKALDNLTRGSGGVVFSQSVLLALVAAGLPRDDAYRIVQRDARAGRGAEGRPFRAGARGGSADGRTGRRPSTGAFDLAPHRCAPRRRGSTLDRPARRAESARAGERSAADAGPRRVAHPGTPAGPRGARSATSTTPGRIAC